jgi:hypothetical protein
MSVTQDKFNQAYCGVTNTAAGTDRVGSVGVDMLSITWSYTGKAITRLYKVCLKLGYYPKCFRDVELVVSSNLIVRLYPGKGLAPHLATLLHRKGLSKTTSRTDSYRSYF